MDDVQWSYGVLLWELLTRGAKPYEGIDAMRMRRHLKDGNRLAKPSPTTPDFVYAHIFFSWRAAKNTSPPPHPRYRLALCACHVPYPCPYLEKFLWAPMRYTDRKIDKLALCLYRTDGRLLLTANLKVT